LRLSRKDTKRIIVMKRCINDYSALAKTNSKSFVVIITRLFYNYESPSYA
jgi:hypothetical protein